MKSTSIRFKHRNTIRTQLRHRDRASAELFHLFSCQTLQDVLPNLPNWLRFRGLKPTILCSLPNLVLAYTACALNAHLKTNSIPLSAPFSGFITCCVHNHSVKKKHTRTAAQGHAIRLRGCGIKSPRGCRNQSIALFTSTHMYVYVEGLEVRRQCSAAYLTAGADIGRSTCHSCLLFSSAPSLL